MVDPILRGFAAGAERASGKFLDVAIQQQGREDDLAQQKIQTSFKQRQLGYEQERLDIAKRAEAQAAAQFKADNTPIDIIDLLEDRGIKDPRMQKHWIDWMGLSVEYGAATGRPIIREKNLGVFAKEARNDKVKAAQTFVLDAQIAQEGVDAIDAQIAEMGAKGKPEELQQLQEQRDVLSKQRTAADNNVGLLQGTDVKIAEEERADIRKKEAEDRALEDKITFARKSGGGGTTKIGGTKEQLIALRAAGKKWTKAQQEAWDLMDASERDVGDAVIKLLASNKNYGLETDEAVRAGMVEKAISLVRGLYGLDEKPTSDKDEFGFTVGEVRNGHVYIGNDQWQKQ